MPKRRERVVPPPATGGWDFRYATSDAVKGWENVCAAAPGNARVTWERITTDPRDRTDRQHPLKGSLGTRTVNGETLEQWQYEVTGGGRLWYVIDDKHKTVWLTEATTGHPNRADELERRLHEIGWDISVASRDPLCWDRGRRST